MTQRLCRCGQPVTDPVRTWCSDECKAAYRAGHVSQKPTQPFVSVSDPSRIPEPLLREPIAAPTAELEQPVRRVIPARFRFSGNGTPAEPEVAVKPLPRPEEAEPRPAGERRAVTIVGPKTQQAVYEGMLEADFPDCITMAPRSKRSRVMEWAQMRAVEPGITNIECAKRMGISPITLNGCITQGRKEGWLKFEDPMSRMEFEIVPKAIDNLSVLLDNKDKTATIETAKGTIFKSYLSSQGVNEQPSTVLALRIDRADGDNLKIVTGRIVGKSKYGHEQEVE